MNSSAFMENLKQLFGECDRDQSGSLGPDEFKELCSKIGLSAEMADETFKRLDIDKSGQITFDEFAAGFNQYKQQAAAAASSSSSSGGKSSGRVAPGASSQATSSTAAYSSTQLADTQQAVAGGAPSTKGTASPPARFKQHLQQQQQAQQQQQQQQQKLSASPVSARARSRASPIRPASGGSATTNGLSLNSTCSRSSSSTNLTASGRSTSSGTHNFGGADSTGGLSSSADLGASYDSGPPPQATAGAGDNVIVYSSDMIGSNGMDYADQASGSGQFGSLLSSTGSYNQMKTMQDLLESVQKLQSENQILTQIFFKDKREREEYISQLGEEFDQQLREVEERANKRARDELEAEKKRLSEMMQAERETLQQHYQTLENISKMVKSSSSSSGTSGNGGGRGDDLGEGGITRVKSQLEDTFSENRQLKKSLMDTKTDVALIWKEMEKLKKQYESKLSNAYEKQRETQHECDHIKLQLNLMKDSNRKLQDASDVITHYITDKVEPVIKVASACNLDQDENSLGPGGGGLRFGNSNNPSAANSRRGSILSEYLNNNNNNDDDDGGGDLESMASSTGAAGNYQAKGAGGGGAAAATTLSSSASTSKLLKRMNGLETSLSRNERFNQSTTSSSSNTTNENLYLNVPTTKSTAAAASDKNNKHQQQQQQQSEANSLKGSRSEGKLATTGPSNGGPAQSIRTKELESQDLAGSKIPEQQQPQQQANPKSSFKSIGRHFLLGNRTQSEPKPKESPADVVVPDTKSASVDRADDPIVEPADGPSVATFNIILVGDSFVGKSSFAARFIEGNFVQGLISNCSIDFKTKTYKVDGTNYTVNLWDTAGQERFRSITASYFRKADGIILMYDVTDKRSYLNVRNWMSTISDTAAENVAVLLVGNKIDLRAKDNKADCVPTDEGFRLAKEYGIVFLETSVKTGANLLPSMGKLLRLIAKNNTAMDEDNDRIRLSDKGRTFNCMPKNC